MLVLALEGATDGHDSPDCQMALRKKKKEKRKITNLKTGHSIQKIFKTNHDHEKKKIMREHFTYSFCHGSLTSSVQ